MINFNIKNYSLYCHLPSHLDRLHTASNELNCSKMSRTTHFINYTWVLTVILHFQAPQKSRHKSAKLPIIYFFYSTSRQLHGGFTSALLGESVHFLNTRYSRRHFNSGTLIPKLFEILSLPVTAWLAVEVWEHSGCKTQPFLSETLSLRQASHCRLWWGQ